MKEKREKIHSAVPIGSVIDKILHSQIPRTGAEITRIGQMWDKIVGEIIAENTRPAALKEKTLLVHVNSSPWLHHLHFLKEDIVRKVNDALSNELIEDILFKIGPVP
jgi:predicted nucleic acid-binding Zn ribbon protein